MTGTDDYYIGRVLCGYTHTVFIFLMLAAAQYPNYSGFRCPSFAFKAAAGKPGVIFQASGVRLQASGRIFCSVLNPQHSSLIFAEP
jgi:hypothetical protein